MKDVINTLEKFKQYRERKICEYIREHSLFCGVPVQWLTTICIVLGCAVLCWVILLVYGIICDHFHLMSVGFKQNSLFHYFISLIDYSANYKYRLVLGGYLLILFSLLFAFFKRKLRNSKEIEAVMLKCSIELMRYEKSISDKIKSANLNFEKRSKEEDVKYLENRKQNLKSACLNRQKVTLTNFYELRGEIRILSEEQENQRNTVNNNEKICQLKKKQAETLEKCYNDCLLYKQDINKNQIEIEILGSQINNIQKDAENHSKTEEDLKFNDAINTINADINSGDINSFYKDSLKSFFYDLLGKASQLKI